MKKQGIILLNKKTVLILLTLLNLAIISGNVLADPIPPPVNDNIAGAIPLLPGGSMTGIYTNESATLEPGEPQHCLGRGNGHSVWFKYTETQARSMTIWTSHGGTRPTTATTLSVYLSIDGNITNLFTIAENENYNLPDRFSQVTFSTAQGRTYYIAVDGVAASAGTFSLSYELNTFPPNDSFVSAERISSFASPSFGITGSTINATSEAGEPNHGNGTGTINSIWYVWTPTGTQSMTFSTEGSAYRLTVSVYTGSAVSALTPVAHNEDYPNSPNRVTFLAIAGTTYHIALDGAGVLTGNSVLKWAPNSAEGSQQVDYNGDLKSEFAVWRPGSGTFYSIDNLGQGSRAMHWGVSGDVPLSGDFDGDLKADIAVWRPSTGTFYVATSRFGQTISQQWGLPGDIPVIGDYDGDDKADFAVWRPSDGVFYILQSRTQAPSYIRWGISGDKPVPADYDGDGKTDVAVWRPSTGVYYILRSSDGTYQAIQWGTGGDLVMPGDYDYDGISDIAIYRPSDNTFWIKGSTGITKSVKWGLPGDVPAPGDYDGNGFTDICVWRPSDGTFYVLPNTAGGQFGSYFTFRWGANGDIPVAGSVVR